MKSYKNIYIYIYTSITAKNEIIIEKKKKKRKKMKRRRFLTSKMNLVNGHISMANGS